MPRPYTLKFYLPDGEPDGVRVVTKPGWSGSGLVVPRARLNATKDRPEFNRPGVYVLVGPSDDGGLPLVYVGEGSPVLPRLDSHLKNKDFWTRCVFFTASDDSLNKAHIQHLEAKLIQRATRAKRCDLQNGTQPTLPQMHESDLADSENFLDDVLSILPLVDFDFFEAPARPQRRTDSDPPASDATPERNDTPLLTLRMKGVIAHGYESNAGFVVLKDSLAVPDTAVTRTCGNHVKAHRESMKANGLLVPHADGYTFTQDHEFNSSSLAAAVVIAGSANGRENWKDPHGRSLNDLQRLAADTTEPTND